MIFLICGEYKTGKTVSACTFPKPMLFLDYDNGFTSVLTTKNKKGELIVSDYAQITVIPFYKNTVIELDFKTSMVGKTSSAPDYTKTSVENFKLYNTVIKELFEQTNYKGTKTLVIDSLTTVFRIWKEAILSVNNLPSLRIADYGTLEGILYSQFMPTIKALVANKIVEHVVLIDHVDLEKDETTGMIIEYPVGPSRNMGRNIGAFFDEIYRQKQEGDKYVWRTKKSGFFQAGSRLNVPDGLEANYANIKSFIEPALLGQNHK